ncbi:MAG: hypothetical protein ABEI80_07970 [Haloplanus sp.]
MSRHCCCCCHHHRHHPPHEGETSGESNVSESEITELTRAIERLNERIDELED